MTRLALALAAVTLSSGCAANLKYAEQWKPPAPLQRGVNLEVTNQRPEDEGAKNPRQVGVMRGGSGKPAPFLIEEPAEVLELVRTASADALHGAGIEASLKAPLVLKAKLKRFWMDALAASATVEVQLELVDSTGATLWSQNCEGKRAGEVTSYGAGSELLNGALELAAADAKARFMEDAFQQAVGR